MRKSTIINRMVKKYQEKNRGIVEVMFEMGRLMTMYEKEVKFRSLATLGMHVHNEIEKLTDVSLSDDVRFFYACYRCNEAFDAKEKKVLLESDLTQDDVRFLTHNKSRSDIIENINLGVLKPPYRFRPKTKRKTIHHDATATVEPGDTHDRVMIRCMDKNGLDREGLQNGLLNLHTRVPQDVLIEELNKAVTNLNKKRSNGQVRLCYYEPAAAMRTG